jgi:hypothetical protein
MASTLARLRSSGFLPAGTPETLVNAAPVDNEVTLHHRSADACQTIRNYRGIFVRMRRSMMRCVEACIEWSLANMLTNLKVLYKGRHFFNSCPATGF